MLQSSMWSQLARLKLQLGVGQKRTIMNPKTLGPTKTLINAAKEEINHSRPECKHWFCGGHRSIALAAQLLNTGHVIAVPTDTIYGIAGVAQNNYSIARIYEIKARDKDKPLAICLSNVSEIQNWSVVDDVPRELLTSLLPGPYTVILKRKPCLNPCLNPGIDTVGIRVPNSHFINSVAKIMGPLALTSANKSNHMSCTDPAEFSDLWPELDGIFYDQKRSNKNQRKKGSTIIDLSIPGYFSIVRAGIGVQGALSILKHYNIKRYTPDET